MNEGLFIAASGGTKQLKKLDVLSNNIANIHTQGFKKEMLVYEEKPTPFRQSGEYATGTLTGNYGNGPNAEASYVLATQSLTNFSQGSLIKTDNPLDVAIEGEGFFVVDTPQGFRYTRNGNFHLDGMGQLVDRKGSMIMTVNEEPILIPFDTRQVTIDQNGTVFGGTEIEPDVLGQLRIINFNNLKSLRQEGEGYYRMADPFAQELPQNDAKILQGYTETSNANAIEEMTQMIGTVRQLEAYQKMIQSIDEADEQSVNNLGRVA